MPTSPRPRRRMLALVTTCLLLSVLVWFNYSAVLPLIVAEWELSGIEAGVVFGAFQAGYMLAILPMGMAADRYPSKFVIGGGAIVAGLASLAFAAFATDFATGTALRFLSGVGMAGVYVPGMRFVSDWFPPEARGRAMGVYVGAYSLSSGLSFLLASSIAAAVDWRTAVGLTSLGALAAGPLVMTFARTSPDATMRDDLTFSLDRALFRNRRYIAAVSVYAWHNWELFGVRNWILAFLVTVPAVASGESPALAGTLAGLVMAVGGAGNLLGGWLSDHAGRSRTIAAALTLSAFSSLTLVAFRDLPLPILVAVLVLYGVALTADSAPTSTAITEVVADDRVGTALSLQSLVGFSTTVVSPVVFGLALDASGFTLAFWTLALGALAGLVSTAVFHRVSRDAPRGPSRSTE